MPQKCKIKIDCHVIGAIMLLLKMSQFGKHRKLNGPLTDFDIRVSIYLNFVFLFFFFIWN